MPEKKLVLKKGSSGAEVMLLQKLLNHRGFKVSVDGNYGIQTQKTVKAYQSQNLDMRGRPLVVDGIVGAVTWWSLENESSSVVVPHVTDYTILPSGGSEWGTKALCAAIAELKDGAREIGGNNSGKWVNKYLNGMAPEGSSWCAAFTSWCFSQASNQNMPFKYSVGARNILAQFKKKGWDYTVDAGNEPLPGDIVVWWRNSIDSWQGHIGLVHHFNAGILYTIEGNRSSRVEGFDYVMSRMDKLLGFGRVPNSWKP